MLIARIAIQYAASGGFTGRGDRKCADSIKSKGKIVWKDER
jgi:hypothetical protein